MVDEIYDRGYQAGRTELHDGIDRIVRRVAGTISAVGPGLAALNRLEWEAPWTAKPKTQC